MTWFGWVVLGWLGFSVVFNIALIGQKRGPVTPSAAIVAFTVCAVLAIGVLRVGTGHL